jgi:hypothetical protein
MFSGTENIRKRRKSSKETEKERVQEDRRYSELFIHKPTQNGNNAIKQGERHYLL